jgi:capsular exopolysaccharide synthesis family protein
MNDPVYFNTQLEILTGSELLRRVAKTLDLEHNEAFRGSQSANGSSTLRRNLARMIGLGGRDDKEKKSQPTDDSLLARSVAPASSSEDLTEARLLAPYVGALRSGLKIEAVKRPGQTYKETRLIDISFSHTDPQIAAKIVNAVTNAYVLSNLERKTETNATAGDFLQRRVAELQSQIRNGEERLNNYAKDHQILSLDANQNTVVERLTGINGQLLAAENERIMAESVYRASLSPGAAKAMAEEGNRQGADAEGKLAELRQRRAQLLIDATEEWPEVKEIDQQIAIIEKQLEVSRDKGASVYIANLETRYRQALSREQALRASFEEQRGATLAQNEAAVNYRIIQQEIQTNKSLLDGLLQRSKENEVVLAGTPNNIHVVDHALVPGSPVGPQRLPSVAAGFVLFLGLGVILAFFLDYLDDTMRSTEDVERILQLPSLGVIPTVRNSNILLPGARHKRNDYGTQTLLINEGAPARFAEAYRQLRTSVLLSTAGRAPKTLLVASSQPNEGKTTTAVNVAISLTQTKANVLIIDADMRRPCMHSIFGLDNDRGLTTILSSEVNDDETLAMIHSHEASGLDVLTSGPIPPNPAELLGSEEMKRLIARLGLIYRYIIIDSPPIAPFTDSVLMSSIVDGVLLVVHGGRSSREQVLRSRKALQEVGARIFGVILNNVTVRSNDYYYHHYYQESYRANGNGNGNGDGNGHGNGNSNGASANGNHAVSRRKDNSLHVT